MDQAQSPDISTELLEQNPLVALAFFAFLMLFATLAVGALSSWIWLITRTFQRKPVLVVEPWSPRVWGFVDLIFAAVIILFWQFQSAAAASRLLGIKRHELTDENNISLSVVALLGIGNLLAMASIILWIVVRHQATFAQIGFGVKKWGKHLGIGVVAAVAVLPLVYALMAAVSIGLDNTYSHPLLESMKRDGSLQAYLLAVVSAALIAPIVEEFLFRVLIQGWLQSWRGSSIKAILLGASESERAKQSHSFATQAPISFEVTDPLQAYAPVPASMDDDSTTPKLESPPLWPAIVTGILFGLAHLGYGLSFIPLIVLGIILGLLYRATHSIWPSLMVHFILNSSSMIALGIGVLLESVAKK